ncbi:Molecular chaperone DnaK [Planctomycetales bacterium 10988]|nr:Molecular chaperone DnaK [Planctomycetales bacterium 10988]
MKFEPNQTVGIDLGTTFSAVAHLNERGDPVPIPNEDGEEETPSLVIFGENGQIIVGASRARAAMEDPDRVVERIKREMGNADFRKEYEGQELTPEFISAMILKKVKQDAEKRIGPIGNAVITVPYYFNDARRKATQDAGRIAGLNVIDIINEPTAATLTYAWHQGQLGYDGKGSSNVAARTALVYDLGGGTFDVTLVKYTPTHFEVLATDGDVHLGGVDWTDRLVDFISDEFLEQNGSDPRESPATLQVLRSDCDQAKIALSDTEQVNISCRHEGKSIRVPVDREEFEEMTGDLIQRTLDTTELVLDMARMEADQVDAIVLVGGSTLMPKVRQALEDLTGVKPYDGLSPHTAVAQGAAIHAAILEAKFRGDDSPLSARIKKRLAGVVQENVNSHGLGVIIRDIRSGKMKNYVMIPRNTKIPVEVKRVFSTTEPNQRRVSVRVVEGDAPDPDACSLIGQCSIEDLPSKLPKGAPIEVSYSFTSAGRVEVSAKDRTGGKEAKTHIERQGLLEENQVDRYADLADGYSVS